MLDIQLTLAMEQTGAEKLCARGHKGHKHKNVKRGGKRIKNLK